MVHLKLYWLVMTMLILHDSPLQWMLNHVCRYRYR